MSPRKPIGGFRVELRNMKQEIKKSENNNKTFWQFVIALISIVLFVLAGGVIIILLQGGHSISGQEVVRGAVFPWVLIIPILVMLGKKAGRPTSRQRRIIRAMLISALILLVLNVLVFWFL